MAAIEALRKAIETREPLDLRPAWTVSQYGGSVVGSQPFGSLGF